MEYYFKRHIFFKDTYFKGYEHFWSLKKIFKKFYTLINVHIECNVTIQKLHLKKRKKYVFLVINKTYIVMHFFLLFKNILDYFYLNY